MLDWAKITHDIDHALTLDNQELIAFLEALPKTDETAQITRLLAQLKPETGFLDTKSQLASTPTNTLQKGEMVGPWKIESLLGKGGMAEVYRAVRDDGLYEQTVALKLMQTVNAERAALFETERQRLARLNHNGIARIIDGGSYTDGRPYMAMDYVDGEPIIQYAAKVKLSINARLALFVEVCNAVNHAHSKLILHRDIKSDNVLINKDNTIKLIDFGIASDLDGASPDFSAMTMACAAPEQLKGEALSVQTDVFALGALLHELITFTRPKRQKDGGMKVEVSAIAQQDLCAIVTCALSLEPSARYSSADDLAKDIISFLAKRPVSARQGKNAYRVTRFLQRNPLSSAMGSLAIIALLGGITSSLIFAKDANEQANVAKLALEKTNWQFERIEATLAAQQAYSDVLMRAFGGDEDVERLSSLLLERWQDAFAQRDSNPDMAAALSYAIGRNFYFRGDTASALQIFDQWMDESIGSQSLRALGEEVYAMMLSDAGRYAESTKIFQRLVEFYGDGSQTSEADASNYANRLARATRKPDDIARSVRLLERRLASLESPFERLFSFSQLAGMHTLQFQFDDAMFAYGETLRIFEENPSFAVYGRDISRFNYASIVLAWKDEKAKAKSLITAILEEDVALKGESIQQARALMLNAIVDVHDNKPEQALADIEKSISLFERFAGKDSALQLLAKAMHAYVLNYANKPADASQLMKTIKQISEQKNSEQRTINQLRLVNIYLTSLNQALPKNDEEWLRQTEIHTEVSSNLTMLYIYKKLADRQLAPAFWQ